MIIILAGDLMIGRTFNKYLENNPKCCDINNECYIFGNTKNIIKPSDLFCVNLETTITNSTTKYPNKVFNYKLKPKLAKVLTTIGINYCALSNNHILDYKAEGLQETIRTLDKLKIKHSGIGIEPAIFSNNNIAIFSVSDHPQEWKGKGPLIINIENTNEVIILKRIIEEKKRNFNILYIHWGPNFIKTPTQSMRNTAKILLESRTVDIIVGTSSHHIQEIEKINGGIVFYGLGSYLDDFAINEEYKSYLGILAYLELDDEYKLKKWKIIPTKIRKDILQVNYQ